MYVLGPGEAEWDPAGKSEELPPGSEGPVRTGQHATGAAHTGNNRLIQPVHMVYCGWKGRK